MLRGISTMPKNAGIFFATNIIKEAKKKYAKRKNISRKQLIDDRTTLESMEKVIKDLSSIISDKVAPAFIIASNKKSSKASGASGTPTKTNRVTEKKTDKITGRVTDRITGRITDRINKRITDKTIYKIADINSYRAA